MPLTRKCWLAVFRRPAGLDASRGGMRSKQRAFRWQRHGVAQRVCVRSTSLQRGDLGRMALQARITVAAWMILSGALGRARGKRSRTSNIRSGAVVGSLAPLVWMRLRPCRRFVGAGIWVDQAADAWRWNG